MRTVETNLYLFIHLIRSVKVNWPAYEEGQAPFNVAAETILL